MESWIGLFLRYIQSNESSYKHANIVEDFTIFALTGINTYVSSQLSTNLKNWEVDYFVLGALRSTWCTPY